MGASPDPADPAVSPSQVPVPRPLPQFLRDLLDSRETPNPDIPPLPYQVRGPRPRRDAPAEPAKPAPRAAPKVLPEASGPDLKRGLLKAVAERGNVVTGAEPRSLFGEILDWMFAPLVLIWPLSIALTFLVARSLADLPFDRNLAERVETLSQQVQLQGDRAIVNMSVYTQDAAVSDEDRANHLFQIVDPAGNVVAGDRKIPVPPAYDGLDPATLRMRIVQMDGTEYRVASIYKLRPRAEEGDPMILIQAAETMDGRNGLANEIVKGVIFPQFVILPISLWLVWFGLSRGLAPLKQMEKRLRERSPDDLSPIDPRGTPEEIMPLVHSFNDVLGRLGENISVQKRFIADAAHQMKTPLAGLKMQAELALRQTDPQELRNSLAKVVQSSDRAAHLISQLLSLARTENLRNGIEFGPVELTALSRQVLEELAPVAIGKNIDLGFEAPGGPVWIDGQPILLHEALQNLIDNALRYTPGNGIVTVRVRPSGEQAVFEVEDNGPGVPAEQRERIFDRFFQASNVASGESAKGSGLGLAIVAEIAHQHRAQLSVEPGLERPLSAEFGETPGAGSRKGHGARFVMRLKRRMARVSDRRDEAEGG